MGSSVRDTNSANFSLVAVEGEVSIKPLMMGPVIFVVRISCIRVRSYIQQSRRTIRAELSKITGIPSWRCPVGKVLNNNGANAKATADASPNLSLHSIRYGGGIEGRVYHQFFISLRHDPNTTQDTRGR